MRYVKEREQQRQKQKFLRLEQERFDKAKQNMTIQQILCRFIPHCKNGGNKQICMPCKHNSASAGQMDNFVPKIAGIKILP